MIRHIVMWDLRAVTAQEREAAAALVKQVFEGLRDKVPGLRHLEIGIDTSRADYACDVVLVSEFESQAALDAYATHPEHLRARSALGELRIARHQVDYTV